MKKHLLIVIVLISLLGFNQTVTSQTGFNPVLEYCTGTWCQYCPCGHAIINGILEAYPNTMVIAYHGRYGSSDPWFSVSAPMIFLLDLQGYPTGILSRNTGIIGRDAWYDKVEIQTNTFQPGVIINVNNKQYDPGTRKITANIQLTSATTLAGDYYLMLILTENNIIYFQQGNSGCMGSNAYIHDHVVKDLVNGSTGTLLNTTDSWTSGTSVTVPLNYVLPVDVVEGNAKMNIFVYRGGGIPSVDQQIQQSRVESITQLTGIINNGIVPENYSLSQNYPNPFNPSTNIKFSIPKDQNVSLKFYNAMGQEVATYVDGFLKAGVYNAEFDGTSLSSGIYFYTLKTPDFVDTKKMILVK